MAMFNMRITPDSTGEPFDLSAGMRDIVVWEKTHRGRSLAQIGDGNLTGGMVYELAYSACRRQGKVPDGLTEAEFLADFDIDVEDDEERAARLRAESLKQRIVEGIVPVDDGPELDPMDPTPPGA